MDAPEGGFDAIMQAIVCKDEIGWRDKVCTLSIKKAFFVGCVIFRVLIEGKFTQPRKCFFEGLCIIGRAGAEM